MGVQLICEGPCNPGVGTYDAAVVAYRRGETSGADGRLSPVQDPALVTAGRTLRYTAHDTAGTGHAICGACSTVRVWGGRR